MIDVTVILLSGGLPSTSITPLEIFAGAGVFWGELLGKPGEPRFRVRTATIDGRKAESYVPLALEPNVALSEVRRTDLVVVPAAGMDLEAARRENAGVVEWLARRGRGQLVVAGICSGVNLLAAAGLLDNRVATTHWALVDECRRLYPKVLWDADRVITQAGNIFCGGGVYASIDLSLHLVERYCGHEVAVQTAKALLLDTPRIWQTSYAALPPRSTHEDEPIQRAQKWLVSHFREEIDLPALAAWVGMSPRHFARRFKAAAGETPLAYVHRLRIDAARRHLENNLRSVNEISRAVGYEDVAFFRRLFQRHVGESPRAYRARFGVKRWA